MSYTFLYLTVNCASLVNKMENVVRRAQIIGHNINSIN